MPSIRTQLSLRVLAQRGGLAAGDQFDGVMNYGMQRPAVLYFAKSAISRSSSKGC